MSEPVFRRLNPLTIAVEFVRVVSRLIVPLAIILFLPRNGESSAEFIAQAIGGFAVFSAFARYWSYSYAIHQGTLTIRSGILVKQVRSIPLEKIQNINISKSLVHRVLGLVDLKIETAAGGGSEASLSALSMDEAERVKSELRGVRRATEAIHAAPPARTLYRASAKELVIAGMTENKALAIVGSVFGFSYLFQSQFESIFRSLDPSQGGSWSLLIAALIGLLALGWVFSVVSTFVAYAGFELQMLDGGIRRHYGLLNQIESVVPIRRIQAIRATQTLFQRWLDMCKLFVETAGSYQKEDIGGSSLVSPLLEFRMLRTLANDLLPGRHVDKIRWRSICRRSIRATAQRALVPLMVIVVVVCLFVGWQWSVLLVPAFACSVCYGWLRFRTTAYGWTDVVFGARHGALSRTTLFVPVERIQTVSVAESPLQRRMRLRSVVVSTAAAGGGHHAIVADLDVQDSDALVREMHAASVRTASLKSEVL